MMFILPLFSQCSHSVRLHMWPLAGLKHFLPLYRLSLPFSIASNKCASSLMADTSPGADKAGGGGSTHAKNIREWWHGRGWGVLCDFNHSGDKEILLHHGDTTQSPPPLALGGGLWELHFWQHVTLQSWGPVCTDITTVRVSLSHWFRLRACSLHEANPFSLHWAFTHPHQVHLCW